MRKGTKNGYKDHDKYILFSLNEYMRAGTKCFCLTQMSVSKSTAWLRCIRFLYWNAVSMVSISCRFVRTPVHCVVVVFRHSSFFFVRRFCYLLFGGSLDFCIAIVCTTQHTSCVSTTRLYQCFAYVMVNSIRCKKLLCEQRKLTLSDSFVVRPIECMHLTPLNVLHAMRM